jgi:putrescine aminotransferase
MTQRDQSPVAKATDLSGEALARCIFPLADRAAVHDKGPNIYVEGRGCELTDETGRTYLDMMSSHTRANSLGYGCQEIAQAVYEQLVRLHYVRNGRQLCGALSGVGEQVGGKGSGSP